MQPLGQKVARQEEVMQLSSGEKILTQHLLSSACYRLEIEGELIDAGDPQSGNWFRFRFVFVSCVRASGRGEAVWACERGVFLNAGGLGSNISSGCGFFLGFAFSFLLLFTWVLMFFRTDCCYVHGLFDLFLFLMVCSWVF